MSRLPLRALSALVFLLGLARSARAEDPPKYDKAFAAVGAPLFQRHCATCHGSTGKGDGPMADHLRVVPPDLTRLAKRNRGSFPSDAVYKVIDGRRSVKGGHGGASMPVWGDAFKTRQDGYSEEQVRDKITGLVHFLASIQER